MPLERLQCPACGASVTTGGHDTFFCNYCGARLKVKLGSSGNAMAVLDAIKEDTGLLARRVAYEHLAEELEDKRLELSRINEAWSAELGDVADKPDMWGLVFNRSTMLRAVLLGIVVMILPLTLSQRWWILVVFYAAAVGWVAWVAWHRHRVTTSARERYWAPQQKCEADIASLEGQVSELKAEIDRLIADL